MKALDPPARRIAVVNLAMVLRRSARLGFFALGFSTLAAKPIAAFTSCFTAGGCIATPPKDDADGDTAFV